MLGYGLSAVAGGWVAARLRGKLPKPARPVGVILLGAAVCDLTSFPHRVWFWIVAILILLPAAELGARLAGARA